MKVLLIGSGGREHALAWKLARHGHRVICAPGNPGIAAVAECCDIAADEHDEIERLALTRSVSLAVVGPEAPLVGGLGDRLRAAGVAVFGPGAAGARLEGSKAFCKRFLARHDIRTAPFQVVASPDDADRAIAELSALGTGVVVKADGLAAGKGVVVCADIAHAQSTAREFLSGRRHGQAGRVLVIEQRIVGRELSMMALIDGTSCRVLASAQDHKPVSDGDVGPNTGGMGAVSPCPELDSETFERIETGVFARTMSGLRSQGIDYRGVLYAGLMLDERGIPWVLEYNCRFGDPETQVLVTRVRDDLAPWLAGVAHGSMPAGPLRWDTRSAVAVVLASAGYPGRADLGRPIVGDLGEGDEVVIFQAGTAYPRATATSDTVTDESRVQRLLTAGGRVLAVTALDASIAGARARAYRRVSAIHFDGMHYRTDIGARRYRGPDLAKE